MDLITPGMLNASSPKDGRWGAVAFIFVKFYGGVYMLFRMPMEGVVNTINNLPWASDWAPEPHVNTFHGYTTVAPAWSPAAVAWVPSRPWRSGSNSGGQAVSLWVRCAEPILHSPYPTMIYKLITTAVEPL